jgi:hypothetical protein
MHSILTVQTNWPSTKTTTDFLTSFSRVMEVASNQKSLKKCPLFTHGSCGQVGLWSQHSKSSLIDTLSTGGSGIRSCTECSDSHQASLQWLPLSSCGGIKTEESISVLKVTTFMQLFHSPYVWQLFCRESLLGLWDYLFNPGKQQDLSNSNASISTSAISWF